MLNESKRTRNLKYRGTAEYKHVNHTHGKVLNKIEERTKYMKIDINDKII